MTMTRTILQRVLAAGCTAYAIVGLGAPFVTVMLGSAPPDHASLTFALALAAIALISNRLALSFKFGETNIDVSPMSVPCIAAAVLLSPNLAAGVVLIALMPELLGDGRPGLLATGSRCMSIWIAAWMTQSLIPHPTDALVLPAALIAATIFESAIIMHGAADRASVRVGDGAAYIRSAAPIATVGILLPSIGVGLIGPYTEEPMIMLFALSVFQVVTVASFRMMQHEQSHRERNAFLRETFGRYMPSTVIDQLDDQQASATLGGEMRDITVMFVDVRNFSMWAEQTNPQDVIAQLNELMTELADAVFESGGTLDKFTGDGLMAFWSAPVEQPDHADRAFASATKMIEKTGVLNDSRRARGLPTLRIGIGIHTGEALVGNVGHHDRHDYTAIGDTVNVAARLEDATKQLGCQALASESTVLALTSASIGPLEYAGSLSIKGRTDEVVAYVIAPDIIVPRVLEARPDARPVRAGIPDIDPDWPMLPPHPGSDEWPDDWATAA